MRKMCYEGRPPRSISSNILWRFLRNHSDYSRLSALSVTRGKDEAPIGFGSSPAQPDDFGAATDVSSTPIYDPKTGETYPTAGFQVWIIHLAMHRNPKLFPDPHKFRPERFLQPELATQPANAFRPFERGPRNCIGQELALLEAKIVMVLIVRRLKVVGAYDSLSELPKERDGMEWSSYATEAEGRRQLWGEEAYQTLRGTAKPRQGLPVRVSFRNAT